MGKPPPELPVVPVVPLVPLVPVVPVVPFVPVVPVVPVVPEVTVPLSPFEELELELELLDSGKHELNIAVVSSKKNKFFIINLELVFTDFISAYP